MVVVKEDELVMPVLSIRYLITVSPVTSEVIKMQHGVYGVYHLGANFCSAPDLVLFLALCVAGLI